MQFKIFNMVGRRVWNFSHTKKKMKVVIAAAGTAGHINPGLAIAQKIQKEQIFRLLILIRRIIIF